MKASKKINTSLEGCPLDWDSAEIIQANLNKDKEGDYAEPNWSWDCNYKLDFDGALIRLSSRFYPPHKNDGPYWEGSVDLLFMEIEISTKEFNCPTLDILVEEVENYKKEIVDQLKTKLKL